MVGWLVGWTGTGTVEERNNRMGGGRRDKKKKKKGMKGRMRGK